MPADPEDPPLLHRHWRRVVAGRGTDTDAEAPVGANRVRAIHQPGQEGPRSGTRRSAASLELSLREALPLGHGYIGTEHLLLGFDP